MKQFVRLVLLALAASSLTQRAAAQSAPDSIRIPILVYHSVAGHHPGQTPDQLKMDVDTAAFREQMSYLAEHKYSVISLAALIDALEGRTPLRDHAVVITFDDGWETQYEHAFPVLKQFGFTATFFIITKPIGHSSLYLTWDQIREMRDAGMTIGSHTRTHPTLTSPDVSLPDEIANSRQDLERNLGTAPDYFAYPYGTWDAQVVAAVRAAGYKGARMSPRGPWNTPADLFTLRSVLVTDDMDAFRATLGSP